MNRSTSPAAALRRSGFAEPDVAVQRLGEDALAQYGGPDLGAALGAAADPDQALLTLLRLAEAAATEPQASGLLSQALDSHQARARLIAVLGASTALGNALVARPGDVALLLDDSGQLPALGAAPEEVRAEALRAVEGLEETAAGVEALRRWYRARLLRIAAADLVAQDPTAVFSEVAAALADAVSAALDSALLVARGDAARAQVPGAREARLCIIGMGKTGGRELNYISDVDVIYATESDEDLSAATELATRLARYVSATVTGVNEPPLWPLDVALRPEGKDGALVRTLASHRAYYEKWAAGWEFQALLKARPIAGDLEIGRQYVDTLRPMVFRAVEKSGFVEDARAMRQRVEAHIPAKEADRQLKLGAGGLRDVEFTVQLLQLVHGRADESIRSGTTLEGLRQLAAGEYVGRRDAERFEEHYRFLRVVEHRIQLHRMQRSHLIPTGEDKLRRLGRAVGVAGVRDGATLTARLRLVRREVRRLHEEIFYRPLLPYTARLSADDVSLTLEAARERLAAIGYKDPSGSLGHIKALTSGLSRAAGIQRQLLPVMLGWFAEGPSPDAALLDFRKLSEAIGSSPWYLKLLRDTDMPERLAILLSGSRYVANALARLPEAVSWLADEDDIAPRSVDAQLAELRALQARRESAEERATAARYLRRRRLLRAAIADVLNVIEPGAASRIITEAADVAITGGLTAAVDEAVARAGLEKAPSRYLVVGMGRFGGQEMGYASDADVLFVHDPKPGVDETVAAKVAEDVAGLVRSLLGKTGSEPPLAVDADLRPEGRQGPIIRTLAAYRQYYERWVEPWERQALLRARPVAGDQALGEEFCALIDPVRYPRDGLVNGQLRELRRIKARVETERLPRGVPANRHLKLGPGGLSDVEWTVQLLQLQHAGADPGLRCVGTLEALGALVAAELVSAEDAEVLTAAWRLASRIRDARVLATGRATGRGVDVLPHEVPELESVARLMGHRAGGRLELEESWLRAARRARAVAERLFYDE
ncbi:bifunctional [glutamine synthetase] adenylyltransferase/[glutamine synthetase]-adenylyl-L-tyrosine phosphorylase [Bogoriella caseilytica]|uniref:Glutamate-ammonia-ligase adenylyltransferase n=1 Tax=Bogoriella caseilytica TaxID=56055 RepID=A0A3N2B9K9_9MICO|nr:bifunctional [glutamine synthetase] adenylyltransferase/[glutamine synthetase]-adenylyl-L-tyrosine phosphorylase [Bogoriella caseilytica]ROR71822.1 glutamate-ammonia-ligase adenylyltransferase [Bogoriella caseilytica]